VSRQRTVRLRTGLIRRDAHDAACQLSVMMNSMHMTRYSVTVTTTTPAAGASALGVMFLNSAMRSVFFISNRIVELLFEILNRIE